MGNLSEKGIPITEDEIIHSCFELDLILDPKDKDSMKQAEEILILKTDEIGDNPRQAEIYGDATPDKEFVASIADRGVLQPVIVAYSVQIEGADTTKPYCMISGHRRRNAAVLAGLRAIPAIVRSYENSTAAEMDFVVANFQREKTRKMRVEEYKRVKQILCQYSEALKVKKAYEGTVFDDLKLWTLSKELNINPEKPFNMREMIAEAVNLSEYEAKYFDWLYDANKLEKMFVELSVLGFSIEGAAAISTRIEELRGLFEDEKISIKAAVDEIKQMFAEAKASMTPEKKKRGRPVKDVTIMDSRVRGNDNGMDSRVRGNDNGMDSGVRGNDNGMDSGVRVNDGQREEKEGLLSEVMEGAVNVERLKTIHHNVGGVRILALHMCDPAGNPIARLYAQLGAVCCEIRMEKLDELIRAEINNKMVD